VAAEVFRQDPAAKHGEVALDIAIDERMEVLVAEHGIDDQGHPLLAEEHAEALREEIATAKVALGSGDALLSVALAAFLDEAKSRVMPQTIDDYRRHLGELQEWLKQAGRWRGSRPTQREGD
jgi:hypothetical protein